MYQPKTLADYEYYKRIRVIQSRLLRRNVRVSLNEIRLVFPMKPENEQYTDLEIDLTVAKFLNEQVKKTSNQEVQKVEILEKVEPKTKEDFLRESMLAYSRTVFNQLYGAKVRRRQWLNIVEICTQLCYIESNGLIPERHLKVISEVMKIKKNKATSELISQYLLMLEILRKKDVTGEVILGISIWMNAIELAKKYKPNLENYPSKPTLYSWFNQSGLSYRSHQRYSPDEAVKVYMRAMF